MKQDSSFPFWLNTEAYLQFRLPKIKPIVGNIPFSCLIMGASFEKWRHFHIVSALFMESMKMEFFKMENLLCLLYLFRGKKSLWFPFSFRYSPSLCWTLTADSSRCSSIHDMQVVISSFPSRPGGLKAFLNKEKIRKKIKNVDVDNQSRAGAPGTLLCINLSWASCRFVPLDLQRQVQPCALSTGSSLQTTY